MTKGRLEAFTDGVVAIIITIMVLEIKVPHGADMETLKAVLPIFLTSCSAISTSAFFGITTITCSMPRSASMAEYYGQTCSCYSGFL
jgi:uncharacterized membrane protein